ncbi:hypothetical protein KBD08_00140 [Candidatus Babeliales bacterium]|nr:hypothetical protein [Candidatus Babeliales bacterium]
MIYSNILLQHHAHIWVGDQGFLQQELIAALQKTICTKHGCKTCITCSQIDQKQHPCIFWLNPEGSYTLEDIDQVLDIVKFKLATHEKRFIVFQNSQELTVACSNRLLKTIEEPHAGYYFIFLASRTDTLLPTIVSRCFVKEFTSQHTSSTYQAILEPFISRSFTNPSNFMKMIDKLEINHQQTKDIIDALLVHYHSMLTKTHKQDPIDFEKMNLYLHYIIIIQQQLGQLPVQGSTKIFWKNLYLLGHHNA